MTTLQFSHRDLIDAAFNNQPAGYVPFWPPETNCSDCDVALAIQAHGAECIRRGVALSPYEYHLAVPNLDEMPESLVAATQVEIAVKQHVDGVEAGAARRLVEDRKGVDPGLFALAEDELAHRTALSRGGRFGDRPGLVASVPVKLWVLVIIMVVVAVFVGRWLGLSGWLARLIG